MQYFRVEDYSSLPFKANGAGLTASVVALANIIPSQIFEITIYPSATYLLGLLFAFGVHTRSMLLNGDTDARERMNNIREFIISALENEQLTPEMEAQLQTLEASAAERHKALLSATSTQKIEIFSAYCYYLSFGCFVTATAYAIYFLSAI